MYERICTFILVPRSFTRDRVPGRMGREVGLAVGAATKGHTISPYQICYVHSTAARQ